MNSRCRLVLIAIAASACGGCGGDGLKLYPLSGKVLLDGAPLSPKEGEVAYVEFMADKAGGNQSLHLPRGPIKPDGTFTVSTVEQSGIEAGAWTARVVYTTPDVAGLKKNAYAVPLSMVAPKYSDFGASGFKVTAGPGSSQMPDLNVSKKP